MWLSGSLFTFVGASRGHLYDSTAFFFCYFAVCYRPTFVPTAHYGAAHVEPSYYDNSVYPSPAPPPPPPAADDWMYGCPQSRTFKILQSVMHNEGHQLHQVPVIRSRIVIVMSISVCLSAHVTRKPHSRTSPKFLFMLRVAVA